MLVTSTVQKRIPKKDQSRTSHRLHSKSTKSATCCGSTSTLMCVTRLGRPQGMRSADPPLALVRSTATPAPIHHRKTTCAAVSVVVVVVAAMRRG